MDTIFLQLSDPFRIGMIFFLLLTALRTRVATGMLLPLAAGVVFVAVIIPLTLQASSVQTSAALMAAIGYGIVTNTVILALCLAGWMGLQKLRS